MPSSRPLCWLLLLSIPLLLTACGGKADPLARLEDLADIPLWQKVGALSLIAMVSEEFACIAAGILASEGILTFAVAWFAVLLGIYAGDMPVYAIGRVGGLSLLRRRPFRWILKEERILQAEEVFRSHAIKIILTSRFLPGSRLPITAAAGVLRYPFWKFLPIHFLAACLFSLILIRVSMWLGEIVLDWLVLYETYALPAALGFALVLWLVVKAIENLATPRGRLVVLARFRRLLGLARRRPRS